MNKDDFIKKVISEFKDYLHPAIREEITIEECDVVKANDITYHGMCIKRKSSIMAPNIYLDEVYDNYCEGEDYDDLMFKLAVTYLDAVASEPAGAVPMPEDIKDKSLCGLRLLSKKGNKKYLNDLVWKDFGVGLVMTADICVPDANGGEWRTKIPKDLLRGCGISNEEFFKDIIYSNSVNFPAIMCPLDMDCATGMLGKNLLEDETCECNSEVYILTTSRSCYGAVAMVYPQVLTKVSERLGGDFYVIPSSVHEVLIVPNSELTNPNALSEMLQSTNKMLQSPDTFLSDSLLYYSTAKKKLIYWDEMEFLN